MSAVVAAVLAGRHAQDGAAILTAVRTAIGVNAALCVLTAVAVAVLLGPQRALAGVEPGQPGRAGQEPVS